MNFYICGKLHKQLVQETERSSTTEVAVVLGNEYASKVIPILIFPTISNFVTFLDFI